MTSGPVPFDHATFVHATFVHATSVCATFVHATSVRATFFHITFVQGQNLVVYKCNHSCLDLTIKTSYRAKPEAETKTAEKTPRKTPKKSKKAATAATETAPSTSEEPEPTDIGSSVNVVYDPKETAGDDEEVSEDAEQLQTELQSYALDLLDTNASWERKQVIQNLVFRKPRVGLVLLQVLEAA